MSFDIERLVQSSCVIGEAPLWVPEERTLYWTDTESYMIWSLKEEEENTLVRNWKLSLPVTSIMKRENGGYLLVTKEGLAFWDSEKNACELIANPLVEHEEWSFNDGAIDRQGRLVTGTMNHIHHSAEEGKIFQLDTNLTLKLMETGLSVANGIGISPDGKRLFVSEQFKGRILSYAYDSELGELSDRRVFATVPEEEGMPDGIIIDAEGYLWNAHWGGGRITRYNPDGERELQVILPVPISACLAFGGDLFQDMYITTGCYQMDDAEKQQHPGSGDLYRIKTEYTGLLEPRFKG